ncbi:MAG: hypothetical protein QF489_10510 [Planctomycetota bacterium]|jgi:hypothetical protein|nr:hypothetical protein [Planctomycetota bacterium]
MSSLLHALTLALLLVPLGACGGEETTDSDGATNAAENIAGDAATKANEAADEVAAKICCDGKCSTPAGYCCSDGTCKGNHEELPLASSL